MVKFIILNRSQFTDSYIGLSDPSFAKAFFQEVILLVTNNSVIDSYYLLQPELKKNLYLDGIVTLVDVKHILEQLDKRKFLIFLSMGHLLSQI